MADLDARALATPDDYRRYFGTDAIGEGREDAIIELLNDASELIYEAAGGREFIVLGTNPLPRSFDVDDAYDWEERELELGDLTSLVDAVDAVKVKDRDGNLLESIADEAVVLLPRVRTRSWQPYDSIRLPATASIRRGYVVEVRGNWGFPEVPNLIRDYTVIQAGEWDARDVSKFSTVFSLSEQMVFRPRALSPAIAEGISRFFRTPTIAA